MSTKIAQLVESGEIIKEIKFKSQDESNLFNEACINLELPIGLSKTLKFDSHGIKRYDLIGIDMQVIIDQN